ncbi:alpha-hydroxy acid oxidase [Streptomyces sp. NPDC031705]|uniref:alpha-hydroxy acid oxidase n=1 Tax=Streptomyces sp. NPDC031705 TaxID=3155729 RepID=UPI0033C54944
MTSRIDAGPDLAERARGVLDPTSFAYYAAGSGENLTLREAPDGWREPRLRPHVLRDVSTVDTRTTLLGTDLAAPVVAAPTAFHSLATPQGEIATARGVASAGSLLVLSARSSREPEAVAEAAGPWWAQIYCLRERAVTEQYVRRVAAAGARALVLTVDAPYVTPRGAELGPLPFDAGDTGARLSDPATRPDALEQDPSLTPGVIARLRDLSGLPVLVKGILRPDDALACVEAGAEGIIVSHHGGRQLDRVLPTSRALPPVVEAVAGRVPVLVDGGILTGLDVLVALALGADAVLVGRPVLWALALGGAAGVESLLHSYREQLSRAMALAGCPTTADITPDLVHTGREHGTPC